MTTSSPNPDSAENLSTDDLRQLLVSSGALLEGHFLLSSGLHSPAYVQCAKLMELPAAGKRVGRALARRIASLRPDSILAPAMGGLLIGYEVAASLGIPFRFTEREDGEMRLRRGFMLDKGERVAIIEDVVTTGKSTLETVRRVELAGAEWVAMGSILDRSRGEHGFPVPFYPLLQLDFPTYAPEDCPLCAAGSKAIKPGSRGLG